jgi:DNA invertase Pin-like site-specific DNA recombinase
VLRESFCLLDDGGGAVSVHFATKIELRLRAAQYVRMSTDRQEYSTQNQMATNAAYAAQRNLEIVRTYPDEGRSGLRIDGRDALQRLIQDVQSGQADFSIVLVYDVSRWGRFQDVDESAYYEFLCKRAGIQVLYCAEQFENDGSLLSTMAKYMKRAMAAEWSRDLSVKVLAGQSRLVKLGFRQGGQPGYGLQRILIGPNRSPKGVLHFGERKSIQTDRIILAPGPPHEVATVQRIFRLFTQESKNAQEITDQLNQESIPYHMGRPWARSTVARMLSSEKYIGNSVFNLTSSKLGQKNTPNPPHVWMRVEGAFDRIIEPATFQAAQRLLTERRGKRPIASRLSNSNILGKLARLFQEKGYLTTEMINAAEGLPHSTLYRKRFGSLRQAYELVGYRQDKNFDYYGGRRDVTATIAKVAEELKHILQAAEKMSDFDRKRDILTLNSEIAASIVVARSVRLPSGSLRWKIGRKIDRSCNFVVLVRMTEGNHTVLDFHLLKPAELPQRRIEFQDWQQFGAFRVESLAELAQRFLSPK